MQGKLASVPPRWRPRQLADAAAQKHKEDHKPAQGAGCFLAGGHSWSLAAYLAYAADNAADAPEEAPPAPDMEEEMRAMFGGVGLATEEDEDEFEAAVWNGSEWVDADPGEGG